MKRINGKVADKVVELGKLVLQFARVNRITLYEDGVTPESDTDHTVMLSLIACAVASEYKKDLDLGLVAQFALVHDFVEVYTGDIPNIHGKMIDKRHLKKKELEQKALKRLEKNFKKVLPWLSKTIKKYEKMDTKEARFVKILDKAMPKITHSLNKMKALKIRGFDKKMAEDTLRDQIISIEKSYGKDQKEAIDIMKLLAKKSLSAF
ncbi:MAG: HD domain-containing protein [Patescibacteria group bacterium]